MSNTFIKLIKLYVDTGKYSFDVGYPSMYNTNKNNFAKYKDNLRVATCSSNLVPFCIFCMVGSFPTISELATFKLGSSEKGTLLVL